jgi:hypothetical protein
VHPNKKCSFKENFTPLLPKDRFFSRLIGRNDSISKGKGLNFKKTNHFFLLFLPQPSKLNQKSNNILANF